MAGAALLAEPRSPHTHTHMQEEEEEEGGPCIFMPGSQEGAGPAGTANRGPLPHRRPAGTAGTARPGHRGRPPHTARPGTGGSAARPAISPPPVMSPAECRGPAGAGRGSGVPSGAGRGGCAAARGALGAARAAQTKETRTDTHTHTPCTALPARSPPAARGGPPAGNLHPSAAGKAPSKLRDCKRQNQRWDKTRRPGWWSCSHLASRCSLCRHPLFDLLPRNHF